MVRPAGTPLAPDELNDLPEPSWRFLLQRGLPLFMVEGFVPLLVFYGTLRAAGLAPAIVASTVVCALIVVWQLRQGHDVGVAVATLVFLLIQSVVGLASHSATVYLAQPVVLSALWGVAYLGSVAIGRPLIGVFANVWYPFPPEFRASAQYRREFGLQSVVWGVYCLARAGLRLELLLTSGIGGFVAISFVTGVPVLAALVFWGLWHARRVFSDVAPTAA
jgi:Protein of unknown function (DUF3159)